MKDTLIVITAAVAGTILGLLAVVMISHLIIAEALVVAAVAAYCFHHVEKRVKPKPRVIPPEFQKFYE